MRKVWLIVILLLLISYVKAEYGSISGKAVDAETGEPLPGVNMKLLDTVLGAATNLDGEYRIDRVKAGFYTIKASMMGYNELTIVEIEVKKDENTKLNISLTPTAIRGREVVVTAKRVNTTTAGLLSNQKRAPSVSSGISAEQISKAPDSRASDAIKRVTGISVVDDKFVFVRGLSERYSNARLNKTALPSPEPDKRDVPFDIFPSNLIDNILVTKSFVPNLPGDFAGGCIQVTTREFPEEFSAKFDISTGLNTQTTFQDFYTYEGGTIDFIGFDDGTRAIPAIVEAASSQKKIRLGGMFDPEGYSAEQIELFGESFNNIWTPYRTTAPINHSYALSLGNQINIFGRPLGFIAAATYKNSHSFREEESFYYTMGPEGLEARHHYDDFQTSTNKIVLSGILNGSYRLTPNHKVSLKTTYTINSDDEVRSYKLLPNRDHNLDEICTRLKWVERSLLSTVFSGEHLLPFLDSELEWRGNYAFATRDEPDTRETLYESDIGADNYCLADESNSGSRFFSYLEDNNIDVALDWIVPLRNVAKVSGKMQVGGGYTKKDREIISHRYRFTPRDNHEVDIYQPAESIFTPENISPDGFQLEENTRATDNYVADQTITAGYLMVDVLLSAKIRAVAGARIENSDQKVTTFDLFNPDAEPIVGEVATTDLMPSANLTYKVNKDMNIRIGFSRTVSRPSFRELSETEFTDIGGHAIVGNSELTRTVIQNYDLGWEWYPDIGENISIAALFKQFDNPIEKEQIPATEPVVSWQNAEKAYNYGLEIELRKNLKFLTTKLDGFTFSGNLTVVKSEIRLDPNGIETTKERPLQGQAPYVTNLMLIYNNESIGTEISTTYNVSGRRISQVGVQGSPNIYEEPFHKLDITVSQPIWRGLKLKITAGNVLDSEIEFTQGDCIQKHYRKGRSFSLTLSYSI